MLLSFLFLAKMQILNIEKNLWKTRFFFLTLLSFQFTTSMLDFFLAG